MPVDPGTVAAIGASAVGLISSLFGHKNKSSSNKYSDLYDDDTAKQLIGGISTTSPNSSWSQIGNFLNTLGSDIGLYANSAFDYYMADRAFQKQVDYNKWALQQEQAYNEKNMSKQYKYDVAMQKRSYNNSLALQNSQNDWSKMMSDTSHQREVADLRAAGLNPILSANGGANAYTSGSAVISGNTPTASNPSALGVQQPDYGSARQSSIARQQLKMQNKLVSAQVNNAKTQDLINLASVGNIQSQIENNKVKTLTTYLDALVNADTNDALASKYRSEASKIDAETLGVVPALIKYYKSGAAAHNAKAGYDVANTDYLSVLKRGKVLENAGLGLQNAINEFRNNLETSNTPRSLGTSFDFSVLGKKGIHIHTGRNQSRY